MLSQSQVWTTEAFQDFVARPENADRLFELINGEIVEKMPGRTRNSELSMVVASLVRPFCRAQGLPCHISGEGGAYAIQGSILAPDFAYKRTPTSDDYPDPVAPEWVIEIISPTDRAPDIRKKRKLYLQAGILHWEMYPDLKSVDVYAPGQPTYTAEIDGILSLGDLIPGLTLSMKELFAEA